MRARRKLKRPSECSLEELGERYKYWLNQAKVYYLNHKQDQLKRNEEWRKLNPEKYKESCREASKRRWLKIRKKPDWVRPKNDEERKQRKKESYQKFYLKNRDEILKKYHDNKNGSRKK